MNCVLSRRNFMLAGVSALALASERVSSASPVTHEADVLVIGAGAAGLSAALAAKESGCSVLLVDENEKPRNATALSWGFFNSSDPLSQSALGIEDSPEKHYAQVFKYGGNLARTDLLRMVCYSAPTALDWLKFHGVEFEPTISRIPLGLYPRTHKIKGGGLALVQKLSDSASAQGIPFIAGSKIVRLHEQPPGGWIAVSRSGVVFRGRKACILACGGFGSDKQRIEGIWPALSNSLCLTPSDGTLMKEAERLGAAVIGQDAVQLILVRPDVKTPFFGPFAEGILLNFQKSRFIREDASYERICSLIASLSRGQATFISNSDSSALPVSFKEAIDAYNKLAGKKEDSEYKKDSHFLKPITTGRSIELKTAIFATLGGLRIDNQAGVMDRRGNAMKGLFACGEVVGGLHGKTMSIGQSLLTCVVLGRTAGRNAALL